MVSHMASQEGYTWYMQPISESQERLKSRDSKIFFNVVQFTLQIEYCFGKRKWCRYSS
ncbi:hypothetical protein ACE6H2_000111 [Prunus campanulata]